MVNRLKKLKDREKRLMFYKDTSLMFAMFFLPFGFDIVQYYLISITESIWSANIIMYFISGVFFTSYFLLLKYINKIS
jgi:hypothetical protein